MKGELCLLPASPALLLVLLVLVDSRHPRSSRHHLTNTHQGEDQLI